MERASEKTGEKGEEVSRGTVGATGWRGERSRDIWYSNRMGEGEGLPAES